MTNFRISVLALAVVIGSFAPVARLRAADATPPSAAPAAKTEKLKFQTDWKGETITLPPGFAPRMTLKGTEEIRFAPGMFNQASDSFFSYAFVFSVPKNQELTKEVIEREMLTYYRGLAESVSKGRGRSVETGKFTFTMEPAPGSPTDTPEKIPASTTVLQFGGALHWVEPFVTGQPQLLHFELQSWSDPATARNYLFACVSPQEARAGTGEGIWQQLRRIRRSFEVAGQ